MLHLLLPKTYLESDSLPNLPMFFLAGPTRGSGDWQTPMTKLLVKKVGPCVVINPNHYKPGYELEGFRISGPENFFPNQTLWERFYLNLAGRSPNHAGCIIFWLGKESETEPRDDGIPYASATRGEIGEWRGHMIHDRAASVVMGAEEGFPDLRTIQRNFAEAVPWFKIHDSMEAVVEEAATFR